METQGTGRKSQGTGPSSQGYGSQGRKRRLATGWGKVHTAFCPIPLSLLLWFLGQNHWLLIKSISFDNKRIKPIGKMTSLPYQMKNVGLDFVESSQFQKLSLADPQDHQKDIHESNQFQNLSLTDPPEDQKKKTNNLGDNDLYAAFKKTQSLKDAIAFLASGQYDTTTAYHGVSDPVTYNCFPYVNVFDEREIEAMTSYMPSPLSVGTYSPTNPQYKHIPTPTFVGLANTPPPFPGRA